MEIINNYQGASIEICENNLEKNIAYLSLKREKNNYSYYYNFKVNNSNCKKGTIYIKNIQNSQYFSSNISIPYIKKVNTWKKIDKNRFKVENNNIVLKVLEDEIFEISLIPRYTLEELNLFMKKIENISFIKIEKKIIPKIVIGNVNNPSIIIVGRQHPGETLSSFFMEGILKNITENHKLLNRFSFIIFPIVNIEGVKQGKHRYYNDVDYNRSWNIKNPPKEVAYIKKELEKYKIEYFIDIHNDEITKTDYIRTSYKSNEKTISGIKVLETMSNTRRFLRGLIKQKKIINIFDKTAKEYVSKKYKCKSILVELSMNSNLDSIENEGYNFIEELCGERNEK